MIKVGLKAMWAHKRRLIGTISSVVLGVAFLTATLVLGDTMRGGFDAAFRDANAGIDALVRNETEIGGEMTSQRGLVDLALIDDLAALPGVAAAEPVVDGIAQIVGEDGNAVGGQGPPTLGGNWVPDEALSVWNLDEGTAPDAPGEVVIDRNSAETAGFSVGDTFTVLTPAPVEVTLVGIAKFGDQDGFGPVTYTLFTLEDAQRYLLGGATDQASSIVLRAEDGVDQAELAATVRSTLAPGLEVLTGDELTAEDNEEISADFVGALETFLLVFAGIALLVATFSIYNTFSILVAQRTRESALLRAIGASRAQVLSSVSIEALLTGVVASAVGVAGGLGLAAGLKALGALVGFDLPGSLTVNPDSVVIAVAAGVIVTFLASIAPAVRAARVAPLAALRDVAVDHSGASPVRLILGVLVMGGAVAMVLSAVFGGGDGAVQQVGTGAVVMVLGVVVLGPVVARPAGALLGLPVAALRGLSGQLARQNAIRNPRRTAGTASALLIGVAVVTLFTVFAASIKNTIDESVNRAFAGDLVVSAAGFSGAGLDPALAAEIAALPQVETAAGLGVGAVRIDGDDRDVTTVEPVTADAVIDLDVSEGTLTDIDADALGVSAFLAEEQGWQVGTELEVAFADGAVETFTIGALFDSRDLAGDVVMSNEAWDPHANPRFDVNVLVELADGVDLAAGKAAVTTVTEAFGAPDPQDREQYVETFAGEVNQFLAIVYVLLALAIIIAVSGIANTLSLSIHERTRELGVLRAVGQTRRQVRTMVRWESVIIALFGTLGGVALGTFLAWSLIEVVAEAERVSFPFTVPPDQIVFVVVLGGLAGVLAGLRPARRAARLDILQAIAAD